MISITIEILARIGVISFNLSLILLMTLLIYLVTQKLISYFVRKQYYAIHQKTYLLVKLSIVGLVNSLTLMFAAVMIMYFSDVVPDVVRTWDTFDNSFFFDRQFRMFLSALKDWNHE